MRYCCRCFSYAAGRARDSTRGEKQWDDTKETPIFPIPQELQLGEGYFELNEETVILVPTRASEDDLFLARFLADELADKYGLILDIEKGSKPLDDKRFILIGSLDNPLVKSYNRDADLGVTKTNPGGGTCYRSMSSGWLSRGATSKARFTGCNRYGNWSEARKGSTSLAKRSRLACTPSGQSSSMSRQG